MGARRESREDPLWRAFPFAPHSRQRLRGHATWKLAALVADRPPVVTVRVSFSVFPFAVLGTRTDTRAVPPLIELLQEIGLPATDALQAAVPLASGAPLSLYVTLKAALKRLPAWGTAGVPTGLPITGFTGGGGGLVGVVVGGGGGGGGAVVRSYE